MSSWARLDEKACRGVARLLSHPTWLQPLLDDQLRLTDLQRAVIRMRYGGDRLQIDEIAKLLRITPARVTQALVRALWRIADLP